MRNAALRLLFLLSVLFYTVPSPVRAQKSRATASAPAVSWVFDVKHDRDSLPRANVYLQVGKKRVHILKTTSEFEKLKPTEYKDRGIPASAITACSGWWAGQGVNLYVVRRGRNLEVFLRGLDEEAETPSPFKRVKVIPVS